MTDKGHDKTSTALSIRDDQLEWTPTQMAALAQMGIEDAPEGDLAVLFHQAKRTGLDPFAKQLHMIGRNVNLAEYGQPPRWGKRYTIQTGIDGLRLVARRAADRRREVISVGQPMWCGEDGVWCEIWPKSKGHPVAAKIVVHRGDGEFPAVVMWDEFVQTTRQGNPTSMWLNMPANQLRKCAEAAALRMAFPQDLSGLYIEDELPAEDVGTVAADPPSRSGSARLRDAAFKTPASAPSVDDGIEDAEVVEEPDGETAESPADATESASVDADTGWGMSDSQRAEIERLVGDLEMSPAAATVAIRRSTGGKAHTLDELTAEGAANVIGYLTERLES